MFVTPARVLAKNKRWRDRNRPHLHAYDHARNRRQPGRFHRKDLKKYGLTPEDYDRMLIGQSGRCACCREPMSRPCVDHDHDTGRVRGLLCTCCNVMLAMAHDEVSRLLAGTHYLKASA